MKTYILDIKHKKNNDAGFKARADITSILTRNGYIEKIIYVGDNKKRIISELIRQKIQLKRILKSLDCESKLVIQYPWNTMTYGFSQYIKKIVLKKNITTVVIIHDLNGVRRVSRISDAYYRFWVKEIQYLNSFDYIICHNNRMKSYLVAQGIRNEKIILLTIFDYLINDRYVEITDQVEEMEKNKINIAGNLSKSKAGYVYKLEELHSCSIEFGLFGPYYTGESNKNIQYHGSFSPEELAIHLKHGFGLVWDGNSLNTCSEAFGEYMRINNPHKLSLYIACGLPVIVWSESAASEFVKKRKIGICVDSLEKLEDTINSLSLDDFLVMKQNVLAVREDILVGNNILRAMDKVKCK